MFQGASQEKTWMVSFLFEIYFFEFQFPNTSWLVPQGEGERTEIDSKNVNLALDDQVAQGNIRLFGTSWSSQVLIFDPQDSEKVDSSDDDEGSQFRG